MFHYIGQRGSDGWLANRKAQRAEEVEVHNGGFSSDYYKSKLLYDSLLKSDADSFIAIRNDVSAVEVAQLFTCFLEFLHWLQPLVVVNAKD